MSDLKPAILSAFISARKFGLWAPNEHVYQLPDASFLCEYFRCVGKLLEDGHFDNANSEALSWKPFLDKVRSCLEFPYWFNQPGRQTIDGLTAQGR